MSHKRLTAFLGTAAAAASLGACTTQTPATEAPAVGMANPASAYCASLGGKSEIRKDKDGGEYSLCHLPDGSVIDEWELYRRDHAKN